MKHILLIISLFLINCGPNQNTNDVCKSNEPLTFSNWVQNYPILIWADSGLNASQKALDFWNESANNKIFMEEVPDNLKDKSVIEIYDLYSNGNMNTFYNKIDQHNDIGTVDSFYYENSKCIILDKSNDYILIAHELGHCLGFSHDLDPISIMAPCVSRNAEATNEIRDFLTKIEINKQPPLPAPGKPNLQLP